MSPLFAFLVPFGAAALTALILTPLVRAVALRLGAVAHPKDDRWHDRPVVLLGGVALWSTTLLVMLLSVARGGSMPAPVIIAATCMFAVGLADDFLHLKPTTKLTAQIAVACLVMLLAPVPRWVGLPGLDILLTILWFVGVTNALNLLDNMDGLCAGIAAIAAVAFCLSVGPTDQPVFSYAAALAGASAAFLVFNFKPASIFMGDSGSLFLGSSLAVLAVQTDHRADAGVLLAMAVPVLIMLIPIFDTTFVTVSRKLSARSASAGGRDHTSHRLVALGFSERQAVLILYLLAATGGASAVALGYNELREARVIAALLLITIVLLGIQLARVKVYGGEDFRSLRDKPFTPLLLEVTYKRRIFEVLLDLCLIPIAYYLAYVIRFDREFPIYQQLFIQSLPIVIACQLVSFFIMGIYRGIWQYFGVSDVTTYLKGLALGTVTSVIALVYMYRFEGYSRGVFIINVLVLGVLLLGSRVSFRIVADLANRRRPSSRPALIYGAGDGGALLVRELRNNPHRRYDPIGFLDDDPAKQHRRIMRVPVLGGLRDIESIFARVHPDVVIVSTDKLDQMQLQFLCEICHERGTQLLQFSFKLDQIQPIAKVGY